METVKAREQGTRQYNMVDCAKLLFAICIVGIHTSLLNVDESLGAWLFSSVFFRSAVPFFFAVSGYFLSKKIFLIPKSNKEAVWKVTRRYCIRLLYPLAFWGGVGVIFNAYDLWTDGRSLIYIVLYSFRSIIFYPPNAMWYLSASIIGAIILTWIYIHSKNGLLIGATITILGYIIVLLCNNYYFLVSENVLGELIYLYMRVFVSARNGLFLAPVFMGIGFILQNEKIRLWSDCHRRFFVIGLIVGVCLLLLESVLLYPLEALDDRGYFLSQLIMIPCLVSACLSTNIKLNMPYKLFRRLSTSIFFTHATIRDLICMIHGGNENNVILFLITVMICIIVAFISYRFKNRYASLLLG